MTIRNPIEWTADVIGLTSAHRAPSLTASVKPELGQPLAIRHIALGDLRHVLREGYEDFGEHRTDVIFLCVFYPIFGLVLARVAAGYDFLPLVFPLASGFALLGPLAGVGLYEMSRRREQGTETSWTNAFSVMSSPAFGSIVALGLFLFLIYMVWLFVAWGIYSITLGPQPPVSIGSFLHDVFATPAGWAMIILGMTVGFVFACVVLTISVVAFPMLLDRNVGVARAITTSIEVVRRNPVPIAAWGLIVAFGLLIGSIPCFVGLLVILPVLGHATWHLYRRAVAP